MLKIFKIRDKNSGLYFVGFNVDNGHIVGVNLYENGRMYVARKEPQAQVTKYNNSKNETQKILYEKHELEVVEFDLVEVKNETF